MLPYPSAAPPAGTFSNGYAETRRPSNSRNPRTSSAREHDEQGRIRRHHGRPGAREHRQGLQEPRPAGIIRAPASTPAIAAVAASSRRRAFGGNASRSSGARRRRAR